jgi:hypothetical protein
MMRTFVFAFIAISLATAPAIGRGATITLTKLVCERQNTLTEDEVYLVIKVDGEELEGYGRDDVHVMKSGQSWDLNAEIEFEEKVVVKVYERDQLEDDSLGTVRIETEGTDSQELNGQIGVRRYHYELFWESDAEDADDEE